MWKCGEKIVFSCPAVGKQKVTFPPNSTHEKLLSVQPCNSLSCCSPIGTLRLKSPALCCEPAIHPSPPPLSPFPEDKTAAAKRQGKWYFSKLWGSRFTRPTDRPTDRLTADSLPPPDVGRRCPKLWPQEIIENIWVLLPSPQIGPAIMAFGWIHLTSSHKSIALKDNTTTLMLPSADYGTLVLSGLCKVCSYQSLHKRHASCWIRF